MKVFGEGSSPRMRGALKNSEVSTVLTGIIPAYAGSTRPARCRWGRVRDHPRVCGEHLPRPTIAEPYLGSSPRMRGALGQRGILRPLGGIIPAYAGSTPDTRRPLAPCRDHPRVCGEHLAVSRVHCERGGSSPRMRGAPSTLAFTPLPFRIIPAYAGSTRSTRGQLPRFGDHPRVCGEH